MYGHAPFAAAPAEKQTFIYHAECATVTGMRGRKTPSPGGEETAEELQMPNIGRRAFVAGSAAALLARTVPASAQDYPDPADHAHHPVPARRQHHHRHPLGQRQARRSAEPADRHRQPRRRRRHGRHARAREVRPRRLHHRARLHRHAGDRPEPLLQRRLRSAQGFLLDRPDRHGAEHAGGASVVSRPSRCRSSSPMPRRTPARSATARPASAPSVTSAASISPPPPASSSCTSPTRAPARR